MEAGKEESEENNRTTRNFKLKSEEKQERDTGFTTSDGETHTSLIIRLLHNEGGKNQC